MTFREWIAHKTPQTLHNVLGYREGTIRMWSSRNVIPRGCWPDIQTAGLANLAELLSMEHQSRS